MYVISCTCPAGLLYAALNLGVYVVLKRRAGQRLREDNDSMGIAVEEEHGLDERNPDARFP